MNEQQSSPATVEVRRNDASADPRLWDQLAAAQERFRTVLDALDASVSVAPIGSIELLFANKRYRRWFGSTTEGHLALVIQGGAMRQQEVSDESLDAVDPFAGLPLGTFMESAQTDHTEIYFKRLAKWLEVSSRYLTWVDGRLVQMVIATDVTARHAAEEHAAAQAEHTQAVGRLITMGEMASSVAHELNQPLAAIGNYCAGILSRNAHGDLDPREFDEVIRKIARQSERAAQVVQHIRAFVKRSEPQRETTTPMRIVNQVRELAEINLRRRQVTFECDTNDAEATIPDIYVDPILIEQVLINLIKNGADSVEAAQRPLEQRYVRLCVRMRGTPPAAAVEFRVTDTGGGFDVKSPQQLFEAFYSTKSDGMGMGLNLCRSIVEAHQGRINAENIYNQGLVVGCRFTFWIPVSARTEPHPGPKAGSNETTMA